MPGTSASTSNDALTNTLSRQPTQEELIEAKKRGWQGWEYGGNPLAHLYSDGGDYLPAFGGAYQPGLYKPPPFKFANPAPLGLAGFALTTFLLSVINLGVAGLNQPNIVIAPALAYGGFIQLLAGMWEIALGRPCSLPNWVEDRCLPSSQATRSVVPHCRPMADSGWVLPSYSSLAASRLRPRMAARRRTSTPCWLST